MCGIEYLDMKEVAKKLKMKSVDAAARRCFNEGIHIMTLGNKRVVSEFEFRLYYDKPTIDMLKGQHGDDWLVFYEAYCNDDYKRYYELIDGRGTTPTRRNNGYNPDDFLNDLGYGKFKNS
jgi:hypothetical protein